MNKGLAAPLGIVAVAAVGVVGGYVYAENAIESGIETLFDNALKTDGIDAASYEAIDVDLIGDTVILTNVTATYDAKTLADAAGGLPPDITMDGKVHEANDTVTMTGIRDLLFGGTTLSSMHAQGTSLTFKGGFQGSSQNENALSGASTRNTDVSLELAVDIANMKATDMDVSAYLTKGTPAPEDIMALNAKGLSFTAVSFKGLLQETRNGVASPSGPIQVEYTVANAQGKDFTPTSYGPISANDISFKITPVEKPEKSFTATANSFAITDTRFVDSVPVKIAYEIDDLVMKPGEIEDPKFQAGLAVVGIDEINMDFKMAYDIDPEAGTGAMGPFVLNLKQAGQIDMAVEFEGLPSIDVLKQMQDAPDSLEQEQLDAIMSTMTVKSAALGYTDHGILKKFVAAQAMQMTGGDIKPVADAFARQGAGLVAMSHGPEKAQEVYGVLNAYLSDPGELRIQLGAAAPINLAQLIQSFAVFGPQALGVFDLSVTTPN